MLHAVLLTKEEKYEAFYLATVLTSNIWLEFRQSHFRFGFCGLQDDCTHVQHMVGVGFCSLQDDCTHVQHMVGVGFYSLQDDCTHVQHMVGVPAFYFRFGFCSLQDDCTHVQHMVGVPAGLFPLRILQ